MNCGNKSGLNTSNAQCSFYREESGLLHLENAVDKNEHGKEHVKLDGLKCLGIAEPIQNEHGKEHVK